jgi:hypothetical protein
MVVALLALCVAIGGVAVAAIPGPGGVIKGCYDPTPGVRHVLSVVDQDADCTSPQVVLPFNQKGPQGKAGSQGKAVPSAAYTTSPFVPKGHVIQLGNKTRTIAGLSLPPGKYVVTAKADVVTHDFDTVAGHLGGKPLAAPGFFAICKLTGPDPDSAHVGASGEVVSDGLSAAAAGSGTTMTLTGTPEFPPRAGGTGIIRLRCTGEKEGEIDYVSLKNVKLTAIAVGDVIRQPALKIVTKKKKTKVPSFRRLKKEKRRRGIRLP